MPAGSGWVKVVLGVLGVALHVLDVIAEGRAGSKAAEAERLGVRARERERERRRAEAERPRK